MSVQYNLEWDPEKAKANKKKHRVSFEAAATIFKDPHALTIFNEEHSDNYGDRWITMGISINGNLLVVVHTYNEINDQSAIIRIISARKATKNEKNQYQGN